MRSQELRTAVGSGDNITITLPTEDCRGKEEDDEIVCRSHVKTTEEIHVSPQRKRRECLWSPSTLAIPKMKCQANKMNF